MSFLPLDALFTASRPGRWPVSDPAGHLADLAQFQADVGANAARLVARGHRRGLMMTQNAYWGAVGLFALLRAGMEVVLPPNNQPETARAIGDAWDLMVCDEPPAGAAGALRLQPATGDTGAPSLPATFAPITFFTSGSTGTPKRAVKSLDNLAREAAAVDAVLGPLVPAGAWVHATVNHQHMYGLAFRLCWPLSSGRPFAGSTHEVLESVCAALSPGALLISSPAHLARLEGLAPVPAGRQPSLVMSAGAPLGEPAADMVRRIFGTAVLEIFGSTETGAVAHRRRDRPDPPWRPLPGVSVAADADGAMQVRSPFLDAPYASPDQIRLDPEGGFSFLGRADAVIKIEGKRVSMPELEQRLRAMAWIADAAVTPLGEPERHLGAAVVLAPAAQPKLAELGHFHFARLLRRELARTIDPAVLPRQWRFVPSLPTGALGKRRQGEIAALFEAEIPVAPAKPTEPETRAVRQVGGGVELDLYVPNDLVQLEGHFPNLPVVPGVAQIDWAMRLAVRHLGIGRETAQTFQVKFRRIMVPGSLVTLKLHCLAAGERLAFEYVAATEVISKGSIALGVA